MRQFGPYLPWALERCGALFLVREDRNGRTPGAPVVMPMARPGSYVRTGEPLNASKRETPPKMNAPESFETPEGPWQTTTWIGGRWTRRKACSRPVLIDRAA